MEMSAVSRLKQPSRRRRAMSYSVDWEITVHIVERDEQIAAHATVETDSRVLYGDGFAYRNAADLDVPAIGCELAAGRALIELGTRLVDRAATDIGRIEGRRLTVMR
jgi:hypothetical protein